MKRRNELNHFREMRLDEGRGGGLERLQKLGVENSDLTLVFAADEPLKGGARLAVEYARKIGEPLLVLQSFICDRDVRRLSTAKQPDLPGFVVAYFRAGW